MAHSADALEALASQNGTEEEEVEIYDETDDTLAETSDFEDDEPLGLEKDDEDDDVPAPAKSAPAPAATPAAKADSGPMSRPEQVKMIHDVMKKLLKLTHGTVSQCKRVGAPEAGAYFQRIATSIEGELKKVAGILKNATEHDKVRQEFEKAQKKLQEAEEKFKSKSKGLLDGSPL